MRLLLTYYLRTDRIKTSLLAISSVAVFLTAFAACNTTPAASVSTSASAISASSPDATTTSVEAIVNATPTPTVPLTPSPTPTPVPEYVEPSIEKETWYNGFVDPRSVRATVVTNPDDIDCLVNKYYTLPSSYVPSDLTAVPHSKSQELRKAAADAYITMYNACKDATGQGLYLVSGYRSFNMQAGLFRRSVNNRGIKFAVKRNAYQGRSEHQLGLALDLCPEGETVYTDGFGSTNVGKWVNQNCHLYGFVRRYQKSYISETGYDNEAWHYRYVGVELATYLHENDMSLEAYFGKCQILPGDE